MAAMSKVKRPKFIKTTDFNGEPTRTYFEYYKNRVLECPVCGEECNFYRRLRYSIDMFNDCLECDHCGLFTNWEFTFQHHKWFDKWEKIWYKHLDERETEREINKTKEVTSDD